MARIREPEGAGPLQDFLADAARRHGVWLVGGTIPLVAVADDKVRNTTLVFDDQGRRIARYDKVHLFGFQRGEERYDEAATIEPGGTVACFDSPAGRAGLFSCTYQVTNSQGLAANARIVINVIAPPTINKPPVAVNDDVAVRIGESIVIFPLRNDTDPDGPSSALRLLSSTTPSLGRADRVGDSITFTAGNVAAPTLITYQVGDDDGGVSTGHVLIDISEPDPVPPVAVDDGAISQHFKSLFKD